MSTVLAASGKNWDDFKPQVKDEFGNAIASKVDQIDLARMHWLAGLANRTIVHLRDA